MEKKKNKKNKIDKEVSELKEKSETKQKKEVVLSKKEEKKEKSKEISKASASKKNNNNEEKKVSWNPFTKEGQYSIKVWFQGLKSELCKIIWPTKPQLIVYTIVVLVTLVSVSVYLFFLGKIFEWLFKGAGIV